jgi:hypothetical protein
MLVGSQPRRVAVIGGVRIPFARANGAYASVGNQEMLTASLKAVVDRFKLGGERLGDVIAGAVMKHSSQWNMARESLLDSGLSPETPGLDVQRACGTSIEAAIRARPDRFRHRRRRRYGQRPADRLRPRVPATAASEPPRPHIRRAHQAMVRIAAAALQAFFPGRRRAAHPHVHGPAHRKDGAQLEDRARRPG